MIPQIPEEQVAAISTAIFSGNKITAIKLYREASGLGLKESKDAIEALETSLRAQYPDKFSASPKGKGCGTAVVLFGLGSLAVTVWLIRSG
jgi:hypothetical protein